MLTSLFALATPCFQKICAVRQKWPKPRKDVFKKLSLSYYGLKSDDQQELAQLEAPHELIEFLHKHGPIAVSGQFGSAFYSEPPNSLGRQFSERDVYSWKPGTRKDAEERPYADGKSVLVVHTVVIIGVKINQQDPLKSHIYFLDPNYATTQLEESGKVFIMSFNLFKEKLERQVLSVYASLPE